MNIHVLLITETNLWEKIQEKEPHSSNYVKKNLDSSNPNIYLQFKMNIKTEFGLLTKKKR